MFYVILIRTKIRKFAIICFWGQKIFNSLGSKYSKLNFSLPIAYTTTKLY